MGGQLRPDDAKSALALGIGTMLICITLGMGRESVPAAALGFTFDMLRKSVGRQA